MRFQRLFFLGQLREACRTTYTTFMGSPTPESWPRSAQFHPLPMTTLGSREKRLRNRSEKCHFRTLRAHRHEASPFRRRWQPVDKKRLKPCRGRPFGL